MILEDTFSPDELERFSKSDFRWADNRKRHFHKRSVKKGEIYQFEFGKNYIPEMSYEHRGLVIGVKQKLLYVLPIFSYDPGKHPDVYHPMEHPNSKSDMFLLKGRDFSFITHDSVLKLNDIRTVSVNRILYQQNGRIPPASDIYRQIESLVLQKYFPGFYHDLEQKDQTIASLIQNARTSEVEKKSLKAENDQLKAELQFLQKNLHPTKRNTI